jgi:carbamoyl-phosphate synthase small subunit
MNDVKSSQDKIAAILVLEDGTIFNGDAIGAVDTVPFTCGELVFNTSMTGYQEIISDPSY